MTGLLTFHQCHNYGAVLQAYGLQKTLKGMGIESEFIDVENSVFTEHGKKAGHNLYRRPMEETVPEKRLIEEQLAERWNYFEDFIRSCLKCSETVENEEQVRALLPGYQMVLVGGDQLWNPELPVALDIYSVPFSCELPRASYGVSMGNGSYISMRKRLFLKNFSVLGVRESGCIPYLEKYTGCRIEQNVDPVFLLNRNQWETFAEGCEPEPYWFVYLFHHGTPDFFLYVRRIREYAGKAKQRVIICANDYVADDRYVKSVISVSPGQWLGYLKGADYVVTNSFHGLAFAVLFEKKFLMLDSEVRKEELLKLCGLGEKAKETIHDLGSAAENEIDYEEVSLRLGKAIEKSRAFLKQLYE
ncbi:MAG: polysaccharide pyruvyl transferase family protein [Clostridiales bacterium]|nr:polysaccharide pyruvyl transferase family protein [Clostridiales bacterium]